MSSRKYGSLSSAFPFCSFFILKILYTGLIGISLCISVCSFALLCLPTSQKRYLLTCRVLSLLASRNYSLPNTIQYSHQSK